MSSPLQHPLPARAVTPLVVVAMLLTAVVAPTPASAAAERTDSERRIERLTVAFHDDARARPSAWGASGYGAASAMDVWTDIRSVARTWSDRMASRGMSHNPDYSRQYGDWRAVAENVGYVSEWLSDGRMDPADEERIARRLVEMWMGSSGHRRNIMDRSFDEFAVGINVVVGSDPRRVTVWGTVNFRDYDGSSRTSGARKVRPFSIEPPDIRGVESPCPDGKVPNGGFRDIPEGSAADHAADCLAWWDISYGTGSGSYSPSRTVTRGMMAAFVARLVRATDTSLPSGSNRFRDDNGHPFERDINAISAAGIVAGYGDGRFRPDAKVTRAHMAKFLENTYRYVTGRSVGSTGTDWFVDDQGDGLEGHIERIADLGLTGGYGGMRYGPSDHVRRDHMAYFLTRTLAAIVEAEPQLRP